MSTNLQSDAKHSHYDNFNKEFEELRVKISHDKAMAILRNINKANKKLFVESAILHYYSDIRSAKITSNSISFENIKDIEEASPSPVMGTGINVDILSQMIATLAGSGLLNQQCTSKVEIEDNYLIECTRCNSLNEEDSVYCACCGIKL